MASSVSNLKIHDFDEDLNASNKFGSCKVIDKLTSMPHAWYVIPGERHGWLNTKKPISC
ncbi:predicted protein [Botrytis cinerea T4]|uniref:Uncharacterized protein n=1 Tax=Botryotinia fuckeliana (strain T4) TaxID=999810 RepID=G2Y0R4_BOTF4|nr:predicted protein [Botrytis cinerea T4]